MVHMANRDIKYIDMVLRRKIIWNKSFIFVSIVET